MGNALEDRPALGGEARAISVSASVLSSNLLVTCIFGLPSAHLALIGV
jgi:hypothetical protein